MSALTLSASDFREAAKYLEVDVATIRAVSKIESSGSAFLEEGTPPILFEGHIFWSQLKKRGINPNEVLETEPEFIHEVLYKKWTKAFYRGGLEEYRRLNFALGINEEAALKSTSWGMFQIMGFNHKQCGYDTVFDFVDAMKLSAYNQLFAFCKFCVANGLVSYLQKKDWAGFAKRYNGPGYKQNKYDEKLQLAYASYSSRASVV